MSEDSFWTGVAEWVPSVIMLVGVLWGMFVVRNVVGSRQRSSGLHTLAVGSQDELMTAHYDAELINGYNVQYSDNPSVHLRELVRITPTKYQEAVGEILGCFKNKRVVSVDLSRMDKRQAARLVDFCSGMLAGGSGWLFRVTPLVIVMTPMMD